MCTCLRVGNCSSCPSSFSAISLLIRHCTTLFSVGVVAHLLSLSKRSLMVVREGNYRVFEKSLALGLDVGEVLLCLDGPVATPGALYKLTSQDGHCYSARSVGMVLQTARALFTLCCGKPLCAA